MGKIEECQSRTATKQDGKEGVPLLHDFIDLVDGVEDDAYRKKADRAWHLFNKGRAGCIS